MQKRQIQIGLLGMNQDVRLQNKQAYEIKNLRINATKDGNALELTSERGTYEVQVSQSLQNDTMIGHAVVGEYIMLFTTDGNGNDKIIRLVPAQQSNDFNVETICNGNLGLSTDNPIETIVSVENQDVMKVYWIDGKNITRVINVAGSLGDIQSRYNISSGGNISYDPFAFNIEIDDIPEITVTKEYTGGLFHSGVVQYAVSFWNKNAQETPVVAMTPLNYVSFSDRGGNVEERVGCNFNIRIETSTHRFDYMRVYQIYRTSVDTTPSVKVIRDVEINKTQSTNTEFNDDNTLGFSFDAYKMLIPQTPITVNTFAHQDQRLFEGNYSEKQYIFDYDKFFDGRTTITWDDDPSIAKKIKYKENNNSVYDYSNQNNGNSSEIKIFKTYEYYKFGIQFQDKYGNWSSVYPVKSSQNTVPITFDGEYAIAPVAHMAISVQDFLSSMFSQDQNGHDILLSNYTKVRPVVSFPTTSERSVLCQGIASPTVTNAGQYWNGTCYAQASWFFRPKYGNEIVSNLLDKVYDSSYIENEHNTPLASSDSGRGEIQSMYFNRNVNDYTVVSEWLHGVYDGTLGKYSKLVLGKYGIDYKDSQDAPWYNNNNAWDVQGCNYRYDHIYFNIIPVQNPNHYYDSVYKVNASSICDHNGDPSSQEYLPVDIEYFAYSGTADVREQKKLDDIENNEHTKYSNTYYVNHDFYTVNSPDIEFDTQVQNVDLGAYRARVVGKAKFKNLQSSYNIIASNPLFINGNTPDPQDQNTFYRSTTLAHGFEKVIVSSTSDNTANGRLATQQCLWFDDVCNIFTYDDETTGWNGTWRMYAYSVYPWQRQWLNNYSANRYNPGDASSNSGDVGITNEQETSKIITKILSNQRYCETEYYDETASEFSPKEIKLHKQEQPTPIVFKDGNIYYGNVDQIVTETSKYFGAKWDYDSNASDTITHHWKYDEIQGYPLITRWDFYALHPNHYGQNNDTYPDYENIKGDNYNLTFARHLTTMAEVSLKNGGISGGTALQEFSTQNTRQTPTPNVSSTDPIVIRYKSTPHIVIENYKNNDNMDVFNIGPTEAACSIVEIVKDPSPSYLDNSKESVMQRQWVPCGEALDLDSNEYLKWTEGDTYIQRYDCLKTYPFSNDDYQSVVEIASFMVETRVNIDGRYDTNRGLDDNTSITNTNFNLINPVYSQKNNFFSYNVIDNENLTREFKNSVIWSLNKQNGAEIDEWTRINTSSSLDLDGDKGSLTKLHRWKNRIYSLQEHAISKIRYNQNVAVPTDKGVPIELGNANMVQGKEYLNEHFGTQNKWTVMDSNDGLYFVDYDTPGIYRIGQDQYGNVGVTNITKNALYGWIQEHKIDRTSYDRNMNEMLFEFKDSDNERQSLAYQDGIFTSFYDYSGPVFGYDNHSVNIHDNKLWYLREDDDFNKFYGVQKPYWIQFIANPLSENQSVAPDCIFDNVEYKADVFKNDIGMIEDTTNSSYPFRTTPDVVTWYETFDKIEAENSYQSSPNENDNPVKFIKKFRQWRVPIPRDGRARMRDNWIKIRLENSSPSENKFIMRDLIVDAFY